MPAYDSVIVSSPPSRWIYDFDLVTLGGRLLLVGTCNIDHGACTWDPLTDQWTEYKLDNPAPEEGADYSDLTTLGAAVVDGRIVIGGGGEHQGFAMWDLASGTVRLSEEPGSVGSTAAADFAGRPMFVVGSSDGPGVAVWDPSATGPHSDGDDWRDAVSVLARPSARDSSIAIEELQSLSYASSAVAAGVLAGRAVLAARGSGGVLVWDIDERRPLIEFGPPDPGSESGPADFERADFERADFELTDFEPADFALAVVDGRPSVVAAGGSCLLVGDLRTGSWSEPLVVPDSDITCLDARTVNDRVAAVTGTEDGAIHVWDLVERRVLQTFGDHDGVVYGARITELDNRPVVISTAHGDAVRCWPLRV